MPLKPLYLHPPLGRVHTVAFRIAIVVDENTVSRDTPLQQMRSYSICTLFTQPKISVRATALIGVSGDQNPLNGAPGHMLKYLVEQNHVIGSYLGGS